MNSEYYQVGRYMPEEEYYEDNHEENEKIFDEDDPYFIEFKQNVKEWMTLDDDIVTLQSAIKDRRKMKDEITPKIMDFMAKFEINDLNTKNGKLKYTKNLYTKPLNKQFLMARLSDYFKDYNKGEKMAQFILENREKEEKFKLRRVKTKKDTSVNI